MNEHKHDSDDTCELHEHSMHGEDCACGCHGHHIHTHEHEHCGLEITHHEGALVATFRRDIKPNEAYNACKEALLSAAQALRDRIKELKGLIGHIKGYILCGGKKLTFSTVGGEFTVTEGENTEINESKLCLVCIVFNVEESILREETEKLSAAFNREY